MRGRFKVPSSFHRCTPSASQVWPTLCHLLTIIGKKPVCHILSSQRTQHEFQAPRLCLFSSSSFCVPLLFDCGQRSLRCHILSSQVMRREVRVSTRFFLESQKPHFFCPLPQNHFPCDSPMPLYSLSNLRFLIQSACFFLAIPCRKFCHVTHSRDRPWTEGSDVF